MFQKRSLTAIATRLRKRFHNRVEEFHQPPEMDDKPTFGKWLLFMLIFLLIGFLFFYILGPQTLFQFPLGTND